MTEATADLSPAIARFGTEEPVAPPRILKAGVLEARLEGGNLRYITIGGVEAIRGVAFLARDKNWGTYNAAIDDLAVDERADGFTRHLPRPRRRRHAEPELHARGSRGRRTAA